MRRGKALIERRCAGFSNRGKINVTHNRIAVSSVNYVKLKICWQLIGRREPMQDRRSGRANKSRVGNISSRQFANNVLFLIKLLVMKQFNSIYEMLSSPAGRK